MKKVYPSVFQNTSLSHSIIFTQSAFRDIAPLYCSPFWPKVFDIVVTLDSYSLPMGWHVKEFRYGFADGPVESHVYQESERIADWAHSEWKSGSTVLIRCQAGLNRSGLITSLILLKEGLSLAQILELIRSKRGEYALSNKHFVEYLTKKVGEA